MQHRCSRHLDDLDDPVLLHVFSFLQPLPDLFNVAASCRRFRDLALDRRSWLYVTHSADGTAAAAAPGSSLANPRARQLAAPSPAGAEDGSGGSSSSPHWYRSQFASLAAAVAASRPGDTILLEPSPVPHIVAAPVAVPHPVHILGGGGEAGDCTIQGARGIEALIEFRASGRLANLTLRATAGACVAHTRGRLTVQGCTLECDACGLPHLAAPLLTRAVSSLPPPRPPATPAGAAKRLPDAPLVPPAAGLAMPLTQLVGQKRPAGAKPAAAAEAAAAGSAVPAAKRLRAWHSACGVAAGAGVLKVLETRIKARGLAVNLQGSGRLSGVRAIYSSGHALVWLQVDSADSGSSSSSSSAAVAGAAREGAATAAAGSGASTSAGSSSKAAAAALPSTPLPGWAARAAASGFDAAAFQLRAQQLAAAPQAAPPLDNAAAATAESAVLPPHQQQQQQQQLPGLQGATASIALKAEEWCLHHSTLAASRGLQPPALLPK